MNKVNLLELEIKVQTIEQNINNSETYSIKDKLDDRYKYLVGIGVIWQVPPAAPPVLPSGVLPLNMFSAESKLEMVSVKGNLLFPPDFPMINLAAIPFHEPNRRYYAMFDPISSNGDEIEIRFKDPAWVYDYVLSINLLLTNSLEVAKYVLHC